MREGGRSPTGNLKVLPSLPPGPPSQLTPKTPLLLTLPPALVTRDARLLSRMAPSFGSPGTDCLLSLASYP